MLMSVVSDRGKIKPLVKLQHRFKSDRKNPGAKNRGIEIVVDDFISRGSEKEQIVVVLPKKRDGPELQELKSKCIFCFAPKRRQPSGDVIINHDDFYILNYAAKKGAVVVSRDNYRNHVNKKLEWDKVISDRILVPVFVRDDLLWPEDPLGPDGPSLDDFLKF